MRYLHLWEKLFKLSFFSTLLFVSCITLIPYLMLFNSVRFKVLGILLFISLATASLVAALIIHKIKEKNVPAAIRMASKFLRYGNPFGWCVLALENIAPWFSLAWPKI